MARLIIAMAVATLMILTGQKDKACIEEIYLLVKYIFRTYMYKGPFTKDIRLKPGFLDPLPPASG